MGEERQRQDTKSVAKLLHFTVERVVLGGGELPEAKSRRPNSSGFCQR